MFEALETVLYLAVIAAVVATTVRDRLSSDPDPIDELHAEYERGEIDEQKLEQQVAFHVDDRNEQIRAVVEDVNGVGPKTSTAIAREYESLDALRATERERLEGVYGVGEETASAVLERVW